MKKNVKKYLVVLMMLTMVFTAVPTGTTVNATGSGGIFTNPNTVYLNLYGNGGSFYGQTSVSPYCSRGLTQSLKFYSETFTKTGCKLLGWATSSTATVPTYGVNATVYMSGTKYLYAVWDKVNVTYNYQCSDISKEIQSYERNKAYSSPSKTRAGYILKGWSRYSNSEYIHYPVGTQVSVSSDTTLYAVWQPDPDKWGFANRGRAIYEETFKKVYGESAGKMLFDYYAEKDENGNITKYPGQGGVCYGMAITAGANMAKTLTPGSLNMKTSSGTNITRLKDIGTIDSNSIFSYNLDTNKVVLDYIKYGHIYQFSKNASMDSKTIKTQSYTTSTVNTSDTLVYENGKYVKYLTENEKSELKTMISAFKQDVPGFKKSYVFCLFWCDKNGNYSGHAVNPISVEEYTGYTRIVMYDNSYAGYKNLDIYKEGSNYKYWIYSGFNGVDSRNACVTYNENTNRYTVRFNYLRYYDSTSTWKNAFSAITTNNSVSSWMSGAYNPAYCLVTAESLSKENINGSDVSEICSTEETENEGNIFWVKKDDFTVKNVNKSEELKVADDNSTISIETKAKTSVTVDMDSEDKIIIDPSKVKSISYSEGKTTYKITPTGTGSATLKLSNDSVTLNKASSTQFKVSKNGKTSTIKNGKNAIK
ncbi:MAG: InlB B-repeat-containing protein [Eubacterium sp.]|nr:InlB B-repeat-containing protein [Eubacterium sp.]